MTYLFDEELGAMRKQALTRIGSEPTFNEKQDLLNNIYSFLRYFTFD